MKQNMIRLFIILISIMAGGCACLPGEGKLMGKGVENSVESWLPGTWNMVSFQIEYPNGHIIYPFGKDARGRLIYESGGRMAVQLMDPARPGLNSQDPLAATESLHKKAFVGYAAYYGTYSVNNAEKIIVHHIEAALIPDWVGTAQKRSFEYDGKRLTLRGRLKLGGTEGVASLVWERMP